MPIEDFTEQGLAKNPKLELAQMKFMLTLSEYQQSKEIKEKLVKAIEDDNMAPWYEQLCQELHWPVNHQFLNKMKGDNSKQLAVLNAAIEDAEKNLGEMEVRETNLRKAEYLSKIGDKDAAIKQFKVTYEKTVSLGHRLDIIFHNIRIGLFYLDHDLITRNIDKAKTLIEEGGDWDRRNRLKVYQGVYSLAIRDFKAASNFFLDTVR